jgi:glycosyltransferase involved in cell wall biosynthesis
LIEKCSFKFQNKLHVIYNPHDILAINEKAKEAISVDEEVIFANDVILFLGRLSYQKAPWHLIKSFRLLLNKNSNLKLVFIGDGDMNVEKHCKDLVNQLQIEQSVFFLGRKSNPYKYLKKAKILALSSYYEGTPNVIVEAIVLEIPVVSSNCTNGIKELMSFELYEKQDQLIITDSGIITPSFFEGKLAIPETTHFIDQEQQFALALEMVLKNEDFKNNLIKNKAGLLEKFDLLTVIQKYLD